MKMLRDLEEVVRLVDDQPGISLSSIGVEVSLRNFIRTHHAIIRDLAAENEKLRDSLAKHVDRVCELAKRLEECEQECREEARLNGMGSEREAALMAKLAVAERDAARYQWLREWTGSMERFDDELDEYIDDRTVAKPTTPGA